MLDLHMTYWNDMEGSRKRIKDAIALTHGEVRAPLPAKVQAQGFQDHRFDGPEAQTLALHMANKIASRAIEVKRHPIGQGQGAQTTATRLAQWGQAGMDRLWPHDDAADMVLNQAEAATIVQLENSQFGRGFPEIKTAAGLYDPRWRRDGAGRGPKDDGYGDDDDGETATAYSAAKLDWMARHFPLEIRLLGRLQQTPIHPRIVGRRVLVDGLLVRSRYTRQRLIRKGWRWEGMDSMQTASTGWGGDELTLYEAWLEDEDGPFAAFSVDGRTTVKVSADSEPLVDGIIDLRKAWGLDRLPISYAYGLRWSHPNPDLRSIPFTHPLRGGIMAKDVIRAAATYHMWATAFMGWAYQPDPVAAAAMADAGLPLTVEVEPMKVVPIAGRLQSLVHEGSGREALLLMQSYDQDVTQEGNTQAVSGGGTSDSAIGQTVQARDAMVAVYHASEGVRRLYEDTASTLLAVGCAISKRYTTELPIARNLETPVAQTGSRSSSSRAPIVLDHDDAGGVYEYEAVYTKRRGEDLATRQQNLGLVKEGVMTVRTFLEEDGDPAPEQTIAELEAEKLAQLPVVQARRLRLAAQYAGDQEQADHLKAMADQMVAPNSTPQQPVPTGLFLGVPQPGGQPGGGVPGLSTPDPGASQLGGIVGAGLQTGPLQSISAAGGDTSGLAPGQMVSNGVA